MRENDSQLSSSLTLMRQATEDEDDDEEEAEENDDEAGKKKSANFFSPLTSLKATKKALAPSSLSRNNKDILRALQNPTQWFKFI